MSGASQVQRRKLVFQSFEEILQDADVLASGEVRMLGNWTLGQVFEHLAKAIDVGVQGSPFSIPILIRLPTRIAMRLFRKRLLTKPMQSGFQLPKRMRSAFLPEPTSVESGLQHLRRAIAAFEQADALPTHPLFGNLTKTQAEQLQCRHSELHLSFAIPSERTPSTSSV